MVGYAELALAPRLAHHKAADVVGLYVDPPAKAIVLCVDEKPSIQALERAQGYLKLPNGRALTGRSHDYKRHGTTTLFAALEVATGRIIAAHSKRRRRVEFLGFMNSIVAAFPDCELHVIVDNLNTHKKNERWLKKTPNVHFHFIPTRSSWLNQIETWFSILQGQSPNGASFTAVEPAPKTSGGPIEPRLIQCSHHLSDETVLGSRLDRSQGFHGRAIATPAASCIVGCHSFRTRATVRCLGSAPLLPIQFRKQYARTRARL